MVGLLQGLVTGPGLAVADHPEIDLTQADALSGGAADKDFIRSVQLVAGDRLLDHLVSQVASQRDDRIVGDALQDRPMVGGV